jgi:3-methylcrotonyl-CoA carboxylase alpha subunit
LGEACTEVEIWPVRTNAEFLGRICLNEEFRAGEVDTGFIARKLDELVGDSEAPDEIWQAAANAMLLTDFGSSSASDPAWDNLTGFRLNASDRLVVALEHKGEIRSVAADGHENWFGYATAHGDTLLVFWQGQSYAFNLPGPGSGRSGGSVADGAILSPMPGKLISVDVAQGDRVAKGQKLLTLEAMKMEHSVTAPFDGKVAELDAALGSQVTEGTLLARIDKMEAE